MKFLIMSLFLATGLAHATEFPNLRGIYVSNVVMCEVDYNFLSAGNPLSGKATFSFVGKPSQVFPDLHLIQGQFYTDDSLVGGDVKLGNSWLRVAYEQVVFVHEDGTNSVDGSIRATLYDKSNRKKIIWNGEAWSEQVRNEFGANEASTVLANPTYTARTTSKKFADALLKNPGVYLPELAKKADLRDGDVTAFSIKCDNQIEKLSPENQ